MPLGLGEFAFFVHFFLSCCFEGTFLSAMGSRYLGLKNKIKKKRKKPEIARLQQVLQNRAVEPTAGHIPSTG